MNTKTKDRQHTMNGEKEKHGGGGTVGCNIHDEKRL